MRNLLIILGIIAMLIGALWIGQGTGFIMWPRSSFMLQQKQWAYYGAFLAIFGVAILIYVHNRHLI
jgi:hypothetical protein